MLYIVYNIISIFYVNVRNSKTYSRQLHNFYGVMYPKLLQKLLLLLILFLCIILLLYKNVILRERILGYIVRLDSKNQGNFTNNSIGYAPTRKNLNRTVIQPITIINEIADRGSSNHGDVSKTAAEPDGRTDLQQTN